MANLCAINEVFAQIFEKLHAFADDNRFKELPGEYRRAQFTENDIIRHISEWDKFHDNIDKMYCFENLNFADVFSKVSVADQEWIVSQLEKINKMCRNFLFTGQTVDKITVSSILDSPHLAHVLKMTNMSRAQVEKLLTENEQVAQAMEHLNTEDCGISSDFLTNLMKDNPLISTLKHVFDMDRLKDAFRNLQNAFVENSDMIECVKMRIHEEHPEILTEIDRLKTILKTEFKLDDFVQHIDSDIMSDRNSFFRTFESFFTENMSVFMEKIPKLFLGNESKDDMVQKCQNYCRIVFRMVLEELNKRKLLSNSDINLFRQLSEFNFASFFKGKQTNPAERRDARLKKYRRKRRHQLKQHKNHHEHR